MLKKVTGVVYDHHDETLSYLIACGIEHTKKNASYEVVLSEADYERFEEHFAQIKEQFREQVTLEFSKDMEAQEGSCRLENENCVIHCGLENGLNGLLEEIDLLK